jgi:aspartokinase
VVVSAVGGVTNELIRLGEMALARVDWESSFEALRARHATIQRELGLSAQEIDVLLGELHDLIRGIALIRELTPRTADDLDELSGDGEARRIESNVAAREEFRGKRGLAGMQHGAHQDRIAALAMTSQEL